MPSVYQLKPRFQALLRPMMRALAYAGWSPNAVTLLALAGSVVVGAAISQARARPVLYLLLPVWLFARMALNAIDGMMARELSLATRLGAVLNEAGDVLSDLALYLPLAFAVQDALWPVVAFSIAAILTEFCGVLGAAMKGRWARATAPSSPVHLRSSPSQSHRLWCGGRGFFPLPRRWQC